MRCLILIASLPLFISAAAGEPSENIVGPPPPVPVLPPIIVTAPKTAPPDRAPTTTKITAEELGNAGIRNLRDFGSIVPNLTARNAADRRTAFFSLRGFVNSTGGFGEPVVTTYMDGIPISDGRGIDPLLFDLESITVKRGPQASSYGKNTPIGVIDIKSARPTDTIHGHAEAQYGNYDTQYYEAAVNGPIRKNKAYFSLAGVFTKQDGFIDNIQLHKSLDDRETAAGRGRLFFCPVPELEITLTGAVQQSSDGPVGFIPYGQRNRLKVAYDLDGGSEWLSTLAAIQAVYDGPGYEISSTFSEREYTLNDARLDLDFSPVKLLGFEESSETRVWSEELRARSTAPLGIWSWSAGAYFEERLERPMLGIEFLSDEIVQGQPPAGLGLPVNAPVINRWRAANESQTYALFGEAVAAPNERFDATLGLRVESFTTEQERRHRLFAVQGNETVLSGPGFTTDMTTVAVLPKLLLTGHPTKNVSIYGEVSRGYRPGGFSHINDTAASAKWKPEFIWNYELGMNGQWFDGRFSLKTCLFYDQVKDFQVRRGVPPQFAILNAERAHSMGAELETTYKPMKCLTVHGALGIVDARFDNFTDKSGNSFDHNLIQLSPAYNSSLSVEYRHKSGFFAWGQFERVGEYALTEVNDINQKDYNLLNARIGYQRKHFEAFLFSQNISDSRYSQFILPNPISGGKITGEGAPRTFGVGVRLKF